MSATLDTSQFKTVWNDNFTQDSSLNTGLFTRQWGNGSEFSFGGNGMTLTSDGTAAGFLTQDGNSGDSYGYGLYQATVSMPTNQSPGAYVSLWPASNNWPGPEIDLAELINGKPYLTVHWDNNGQNDYQAYFFNADITKPTTIAVDWAASGLTFYVNGKQVVQYPAGGSVPVPKDAAHGGQNEAFGVGNSGPSGTTLTVSDMSYSAPTGGGGSSGGSAAPTASAAITPQTTSQASATFQSSGSGGGAGNQSLSTSSGSHVLVGNGALDTFTIDATNGGGWAEIDNFHSGDVAHILGFVQGKSTITWTSATDPAGQSGATARISLNGNGHTDMAVTFAGSSVAAAQGFASGEWHTSDGTPYLSVWKV